MIFTALDEVIIAGYLVFALGGELVFARRAGRTWSSSSSPGVSSLGG